MIKWMITLTLQWLKQLQTAPFSYSYALLSSPFSFTVLHLCRQWSKKPKEKPVEEVDENPVYDMYYFADGDRIDYGNVEVEDENQMYGTQLN